MDRDKLKDSRGRPLTQSLFLEIGYKTEFAVYTLDDVDKKYKGKTYPSLKALYLEMEDPIEYNFATTHLLGWQHWQRLCANKIVGKHVAEWREELELKLRSDAISEIIEISTTEKGFQAAKFVAKKEWEVKQAGRPKVVDQEKEDRIQEKLEDEFSADIIRLGDRK